MNFSKSKLILLVAVAAGLASSCKKDFLNLEPPSQIPSDQAIVDESSMQTAVIGMYQSLRAVDYFGRSLPIDGDLLADNIYIDPFNNSNRYLVELTYSYIATYGNVQNTWAEIYNTILRANNIINANVPVSDNVNQLKGEALTIRALSYFELVKFFAKPYTIDANALGVPIVTRYDSFAKPARATVGQVYTQMESDLVQAYGLMTDESKNSSYITKYVAGGLLARLYQYKGDWAKAEEAALDVVNNGGYFLTRDVVSYWSNPFPVSNRVETMFEVEFDNIGQNFTDNLDNFYSQDPSAYGDALCTDNLYSSYSTTDTRLSLIIEAPRAGRNIWACNKYPNTTNPNGKDNIKIMRYSELLLILAEAYNRNGDDGSAQTVLNQLAQLRDPAFAGYSDTGADLLNDIYLERRRELAFEGHRYWDLVRLNLDVERDNSTGNYSGNTPLELLSTSDRRIFPIPQAEINANKNVTQNQGY